MKPLPPCRDCPDRRVGCHDPAACARWAAFEAENRKYRAECRASWDERGIMGDYVRGQQSRVARQKKNRKDR